MIWREILSQVTSKNRLVHFSKSGGVSWEATSICGIAIIRGKAFKPVLLDYNGDISLHRKNDWLAWFRIFNLSIEAFDDSLEIWTVGD
jgi:hypothetical protein